VPDVHVTDGGQSVGLKLWWLWEESTTVVHTVRLSFGEIPWF